MTTAQLISSLEYVRSRLFVAMNELEHGRPSAAAQEIVAAGRALRDAAKDLARGAAA